MTRIPTIPTLMLAAAGLTTFTGGVFAAPVPKDAHCTLTYKATVNAEGPCTFFQEGSVTSVHGTVAENGQKYTATIDNSKNEGLLIGAGTFALADGKLDQNDRLEVRWPNGYVLIVKPK